MPCIKDMPIEPSGRLCHLNRHMIGTTQFGYRNPKRFTNPRSIHAAAATADLLILRFLLLELFFSSPQPGHTKTVGVLVVASCFLHDRSSRARSGLRDGNPKPKIEQVISRISFFPYISKIFQGGSPKYEKTGI